MRRKHRGGYYGAVGAIAPGAMQWGRGSEMGNWAISSRGGNTQYGSGKRKSKKGGVLVCENGQDIDKATGKCTDGSSPIDQPDYMGGKRKRSMKNKKRKNKKRTMKGGNKFGGVSASFQGTGSRGIADYKPIITRDGSGAAAGGAFNNFGAQPGSGYSSFVRAA